MGRWSTGAWCNFEVTRLEMSHFSDIGLKDNVRAVRVISWTGGERILVYWDTTIELANCRLVYTITHTDGTKVDLDYMIRIDRVPSNLGKGFRLYFVCPVCNKRASILYSCYGSDYFKHRDAYQNRIYYLKQMESKKWRNLDLTRLRARIEKLETERYQTHYKGKLTKREKKLRELREELWYRDANLTSMLYQTFKK